MNIRVLSLILLSALISIQKVHGSDGEIIPNLIGYLNANATDKTPYEKLQLISELKKQQRIARDSYAMIAQELIIQHVYAEENDTPLKRFTAYNNAEKLSRLQKQGYLREILVNDLLSADSDYQSGTSVKRIIILASYDKTHDLGSQCFLPKIKELRRRELSNRFENKGIEDRGLITLKFFSELKEKGFNSKWLNYGEEYEPLSEHLTLNSEFQGLDNDDKITYLQSLHESKLIAIHTLSSFEAIYYIDDLSQDKKFVRMNDEEKASFLKEKRDANEMHLFTEGKIKHAFNMK